MNRHGGWTGLLKTPESWQVRSGSRYAAVLAYPGRSSRMGPAGALEESDP
jgi:hypothetical protein